MDLETYIKDPARRLSLAKACGTSPNYLWQVATNWRDRKPGPALALCIHENTHGLIDKAQLRPDLWGRPAGEGGNG